MSIQCPLCYGRGEIPDPTEFHWSRNRKDGRWAVVGPKGRSHETVAVLGRNGKVRPVLLGVELRAGWSPGTSVYEVT